MRAGAEAVSLRGGGDGSAELWDDRLVTWVCPGPLRRYVKEMARSRSSSTKSVKEREVYVGALELDRALEEGLKAESVRLRAYAAAQGLDLTGDQAEAHFRELVVRLVKAGLDAAEVKPPKPKK